MGIGQDPPYAYKDKTDNYEAALNAQRVRIKKSALFRLVLIATIVSFLF